MGFHSHPPLDFKTDVFIIGVEKREKRVIPACAKLNAPVATLLSPSEAFLSFSIFHCLHPNKAFVSLTQTHSALNIKGKEKTFSCMSGFLLHLNRNQIRARRQFADEKRESGCQVQWKAHFAYQRSAIMSRAMHTLR